MKKLIYFILGLAVMLTTSCSDDDNDTQWITPPSSGAKMTLQGGPGEQNAIYSVFVDFSANEQDTVKRSSYSLAFNCGSEFGVFLNSTNIGRAKEITGIEMNKVMTETELKPYVDELAMPMGGDTPASMDIVDDFDKYISGTVIKEGKTYIYRNEDATLPFYKVKVTKKDNDTYTVSYSLSNSADVKSVDVKKDTKYRTIGFSFTENKTVVTEKADWDILWGRNTYESARAAGMPTAMADIVFINNKGGVKAAMVMTKDIAFNDFSEADIKSVTLSSDIGVIGDSWRGMEGMALFLQTDRYYIIQDTDKNIYKLKFLTLGGNDGGTRGYPQIEFELVREAQ